MQSKVLSTLGLVRRAGRLNYGYDMVMAGLHKTHLLLLAEDCAERTVRNIERVAAEYRIPLCRLPYTKEHFGAGLGTKPVGVLGVADQGFAQSLVKCIEGGK